jgi:hypothetical protein
MTTGPEKIDSDELITRGSVAETDPNVLKLKVSLWISGGALAVGFISLLIAVKINDQELKTWATGLISLVVGTAIGFAFSSSNKS